MDCLSNFVVDGPISAPGSARGGGRSAIDRVTPDLQAQRLADAEATFFGSSCEKEAIRSARRKYPRQKKNCAETNPFTGEQDETIQRRITGFGLGFEKIFATTSVKLPASAYTIFVELQSAQNGVTFSRRFNGLHCVLDLKKWIFEKLLVPMNAYDLSYAEPGKATVTDTLRLLTTQDSLDTRTLATTRTVHSMYKGTPGVHSINDVGVTKLYARLKCKRCGDLLNNVQSHPDLISLGGSCSDRREICGCDKEPLDDMPSFMRGCVAGKGSGKGSGKRSISAGQGAYRRSSLWSEAAVEANTDPDPMEATITYIDCVKVYRKGKYCYFHTRGYELFEAARAHSGASELARIYLSCNEEPSKKMQIAKNTLAGGRTEPLY